MTLADRLRPRLDSRRALLWIVGVAVLLTLPSLGAGWVMDDLVHQAALAPDGPAYLRRAPTELYSFMPDSNAWRREATESGWIPWYADPEMHAELWRPLSSLTLYPDHVWFADRPAFGHLQSVLWYGLLVLLAGLVYRRLSPTVWVAGLATLLYAIDDAHGHPVGWVANRHALVSVVFALAALGAHVRWRLDGWRAGAVLAPAALAAGLLAGETAVSITAYLFCFAVFLDRGSWKSRALSLAPAAAVVVGWRIAYRVLGYGAAGMDLYIDPLAEPGRYLRAVAERLPLLLQGQLTPVTADLAPFLPKGAAPLAAVAATFTVVVILLVLWRLLRRDRRAAFWASSMVLSALPVCATFASDRVLFVTGIGAMGLVAQVLARAGEALDDFWTRRSVRWLGGLLAATHLVMAPLLLPLRSYFPAIMQSGYDGAYRSMDQLGDLTDRTLIIVNGPDAFWTSYTSLCRAHLGRTVPNRVLALATGLASSRVTRVDARSLRLESEEGYLTSFLDRLFRHPERPFAPGDTVRVSDVEIRLEKVTDDGRPVALLCVFDNSLEQPNRVWAVWSKRGYVPFELPAIGAVVEIDATAVSDLASFEYGS